MLVHVCLGMPMRVMDDNSARSALFRLLEKLPKKKTTAAKAWVRKRQPRVYFISNGNEVKIGISRTPQARLAGLQVGNSERLQLLGTVEGGAVKERELHYRFLLSRLKGEWFSITPDLADFLATQINRDDVADLTLTEDKASMSPMHTKASNGRTKSSLQLIAFKIDPKTLKQLDELVQIATEEARRIGELPPSRAQVIRRAIRFTVANWLPGRSTVIPSVQDGARENRD